MDIAANILRQWEVTKIILFLLKADVGGDQMVYGGTFSTQELVERMDELAELIGAYNDWMYKVGQPQDKVQTVFAAEMIIRAVDQGLIQDDGKLNEARYQRSREALLLCTRVLTDCVQGRAAEPIYETGRAQ